MNRGIIILMALPVICVFVLAGCRKVSQTSTKNVIELELKHGAAGKFEFIRSKPRKRVGRIIVYSGEGEMVWNLTYGNRDFTSIVYGEIPKFAPTAKSPMDPQQARPNEGKPQELKEGEQVEFILEYADDKLPMSPSNSSEVWIGVVPKAGGSTTMRIEPRANQ